MLKRIKDPVSCLTHLFGVAVSLLCLLGLLHAAKPHGARYIVSFIIFGASLILLYSASSVYHMLRLDERATKVLRQLDHTMIFYLIAGTYTPVCLIPLYGPWGWSLLGTVWGLAFAGTFMKLFWMKAPRMLSTGIYLFMGWIVLAAFYPLAKAISGPALALLIAGGVCYTAGAVIYALKWPKLPIPGFGFHEVFHLFVLAGSAFHIALMFSLLP